MIKFWIATLSVGIFFITLMSQGIKWTLEKKSDNSLLKAAGNTIFFLSGFISFVVAYIGLFLIATGSNNFVMKPIKEDSVKYELVKEPLYRIR